MLLVVLLEQLAHLFRAGSFFGGSGGFGVGRGLRGLGFSLRMHFGGFRRSGGKCRRFRYGNFLERLRTFRALLLCGVCCSDDCVSWAGAAAAALTGLSWSENMVVGLREISPKSECWLRRAEKQNWARSSQGDQSTSLQTPCGGKARVSGFQGLYYKP